MNPAKYNLTIRTGITFGPLNITCRNKDKVPINLTGWQVFAQARIATNRPDLINLGPTITNAAGGVITIQIAKEQTATFQPGDYSWDLILQDPSGKRFGPYLEGRCRVLSTITRL